MTIKTRKNGTTRFTLYFSQVNSCFVFTRIDAGVNTETTLLECQDEIEAIIYWHDRLKFYCDVVGINYIDLEY